MLDSAHIRLQKISGLRVKSGLIMLCKTRNPLQILLFSQKLATETYKVSKGFLPPLITELFEPRNEHPYNLRYLSEFNTPSVNTVYHGTESIFFLGHKIWTLLPKELKNIQILKAFKNRIKIKSLKTVLVEFVRFISGMLKKIFLDHPFLRC